MAPVEDANKSGDWSACGDSLSSEMASAAELREHVAYLRGKLEAQADLLRDLKVEKDAALKEKCLLEAGAGTVTDKGKYLLPSAEAQKLNEESDAPSDMLLDAVSKMLKYHEQVPDAVDNQKIGFETLFRECGKIKLAIDQISAHFSDMKKEHERQKKETLAALEKKKSVWKSTASVHARTSSAGFMVDELSAPAMADGVHEWSIKVHEYKEGVRKEGVRLGVTSDRNVNFNQDLGSTAQTWGYAANGFAYNNNKMIGGMRPVYSSGSIVKFILDMNQGTLCAGVDGKPAIELFSNMTGTGRLIPAASLSAGSRVQFLGFE